MATDAVLSEFNADTPHTPNAATAITTDEIEEHSFEPFIIRICFEWYEGIGQTMSDEADTLVGTSQEHETLQIRANIKFESEKTFSDLKHGLFRFDFYLEL